MNKFKQANIDIDRKILADLAVRDPDAFAQLIQETSVTE
jgi:large subunit ribosomal protein L20